MGTNHNTPIPIPHDCSQYEILNKIDEKLDTIIDRLGKGDTAIALLDHRVTGVEKIVYGMCALSLLAVAGGLIALVIK